MPRNASGTYTLPAGNPVVTGTTIASSWANTTLDDIKTEMTDSLSRSAKGGMLSPLGLVDGTVGAPGLAFNSELSTGLYRVAANQLGVTVAGTQRLLFEGTAPVAKFTSPLLAADAGDDYVFDTTNNRTAGNLFAVKTAAANRFVITAGGAIVASATVGEYYVSGDNVGLRTQGTNSSLRLMGNRAAADAGADVVITGTTTRTGGWLCAIQNNGTTRFNFDFPGDFGLTTAATTSTIYQQTTNGGLLLRGNKNAADIGTDVVVNSLATRTAGQLLDVQNNGSSRGTVFADGTIRSFGTGVFSVQGSANQINTSTTNGQLTLVGNKNAADTGTDVAFSTTAVRTAGQLVDITNNGTSKVDVGFNGIIHAPNVWQQSEVTANDAVTGTTMQSVAGLSFGVAANVDYIAEFIITANTSATAIHQVQLTGPAAPTKAVMGAQGIFGTTVSGFGAAAFSTAFQIQPANITTEAVVIINLFLRNGVNAGTVQLQHNTNTAGQTATIFAGSIVRWQRVDNAGKP